ncbi:MAG: signal peptidase I [Planctomycetota bacterium]|jgi:signal peptidase I
MTADKAKVAVEAAVQIAGTAAGASTWHKFRENMEAIIIAIVLALVIRHFTVQAFEIPTGSMAPTLYGDHRPQTCPQCTWKFSLGASRNGGPWPSLPDSVICPNCHHKFHPIESGTTGHKILVNKFIYAFSEPQRWDVIVFKFPEKPWKDYIKRLVGLPGEELAIRNGDIYANGKILRKSDNIQKNLWFPVFDMHYMPRKPELNPWYGHCNSGWTVKPDGLEVSTVERTIARFRKHAFDTAQRGIDDAAARFRTSYNNVAGFQIDGEDTPIADAKIGFEIKPSKKGGACEVILREERNDRELEHRFVIRIEGDGGNATGLYRHDEPLQTDNNIAIPANTVTNVECVHRDDRMQLWINGEKVLEHDYEDGDSTSSWDELEDVELEFVAENASAAITNVTVFRDIYHSENYGPETIPEGHYFALGDNTTNSHDSRKWLRNFLPRENLVGKAFMIFWKPWEIRLIK